jgi:alkanesulfonate monooxygenase SsuD/methylene tetrahydromethanopterin reductase-like flavin-dependent oxidoreductase (luciferase family)
MEEWVELLRALSADGPVTFEGEHVQLHDFTLRPGFVQRPLPIWMVANPSPAAGERTLERVLGRVARLGDGWMTFGTQPGLIAERLERIREQRAALGRDEDPDFPVCAYVDVNVDHDERRALADAVETSVREGRRNVTPEALRTSAAIGSPERCLEFLGALAEAGTNCFALRPLSSRPLAQLDALGALAQRMEIAGPVAPPATTR